MTKIFEHNHFYTIGLVYDTPEKLKNSTSMIFPSESNAEWETEETILKIRETWKQLGHHVIDFPLNNHFLNHWEKNYKKCNVIHSLVEGFGSLSREAWIPSLCELSGLPLIGPTPYAHSICMNKFQTKLLCQHLNIPTAPFHIILHSRDVDNIDDDFLNNFHFIKPNGEGSGMGVDEVNSISNSKTKTKNVCEELLKKFPHGVLLEKLLNGPEYTSSFICDSIFLPIAQIEVKSGIYGLANKGKDIMEEKVTFPVLPYSLEQIIQNGTQKLFSFLNLHDVNRMDWKCDEEGNCYFLECNTLPGLSYYYSVLPKMAFAAGFSYESFFQKILESAMTRKNSRNLWYGKTRVQ